MITAKEVNERMEEIRKITLKENSKLIEQKIEDVIYICEKKVIIAIGRGERECWFNIDNIVDDLICYEFIITNVLSKLRELGYTVREFRDSSLSSDIVINW